MRRLRVESVDQLRLFQVEVRRSQHTCAFIADNRNVQEVLLSGSVLQSVQCCIVLAVPAIYCQSNICWSR